MDSLSFSDLVSKILRELPNQFGLDKETMPGSYELWSYKKTYVSNEGSGDFRRRKKNQVPILQLCSEAFKPGFISIWEFSIINSWYDKQANLFHVAL